MSHRFFRIALPCATIAINVFLQSAICASAADVAIAPISITLGPRERATSVVLSNVSDVAERMQVDVASWTIDASGAEAGAPTNDLFAFPVIFTIPPHAQQRIRLATVLPPSERERAYRLRIEEVPPAALPGSGAVVTFRNEYVLPVRQAPLKPQPALATPTAAIHHATLGLSFANDGNVSLHINHLKISGVGADFDRVLSSVVLLVDGKRDLSISLSPAECKGLQAVRIDAVSTEGPKFQQTLPVNPNGCSA
jgi:fimbrial chaperone protein